MLFRSAVTDNNVSDPSDNEDEISAEPVTEPTEGEDNVNEPVEEDVPLTDSSNTEAE